MLVCEKITKDVIDFFINQTEMWEITCFDRVGKVLFCLKEHGQF